MTHFVKSALLVAALSAPIAGGFAPAAFGAESAAQTQAPQSQLLTIKSDRGAQTPKAQMILASIAAENGN